MYPPDGGSPGRTQLLWAGLGLLAYLAGAVLFISFIAAMFSAGGMSEAVLTTGNILVLVMSAMLFALGGYFLWRGGVTSGLSLIGGYAWGYNTGTSPSRQRQDGLPEQFRSPPPEQESAETVEESREARSRTTTGTVCPHCGTENEGEFRFCENCSKKLNG